MFRCKALVLIPSDEDDNKMELVIKDGFYIEALTDDSGPHAVVLVDKKLHVVKLSNVHWTGWVD